MFAFATRWRCCACDLGRSLFSFQTHLLQISPQLLLRNQNRIHRHQLEISYTHRHHEVLPWQTHRLIPTCTSSCSCLSSSALFFRISALSCSLCLKSKAESLTAICLLRFCSTVSSRFRFLAACRSSLSILSRMNFITWLHTIILENTNVNPELFLLRACAAKERVCGSG